MTRIGRPISVASYLIINMIKYSTRDLIQKGGLRDSRWQWTERDRTRSDQYQDHALFLGEDVAEGLLQLA